MQEIIIFISSQIPPYGDELWYRGYHIADVHLNMSNPLQQCPCIRLEGNHNGWNKSLCMSNFYNILKEVAPVFSTMLVVSTAKFVEESLAFSLEVHLFLRMSILQLMKPMLKV